MSNNNKISFSVASTFKSSLNQHGSDNNSETRVFVTEFDPSKDLFEKKSTHVIPAIPNKWKPETRMQNLDIPLRAAAASDDPDSRFELEAPTLMSDKNDPSGSYGLILRNKDDKAVLGGTVSGSENVSVQRFKEDMENLPDDRGMDEFVGVPVEGFGAAVLSAYGWSKGMAVGNKEGVKDVPVVQFVRKNFDREGLGFVPDANVKVDSKKKSRYSGPQLVAPKGPDGRNRHVVGIDEKLVPRELKGIHVGKTVRIIGGLHEGLKGKVIDKIEYKSSYKVVLRLLKSGMDVTVRIDDVAEVDSVEEEKWLKCDTKKRKREKEDREKRGKEERKAPSWLRSHIRVKVISDDFKRGKLYLKKGKVVDVIGPGVCDIRMDENNELVQEVHQDVLQTSLPQLKGPVLVLFGKHKGMYGRLMSKNKDKETGVIEDADTRELHSVQLDQIAEYIGDPSDIGY